MEDITKLLFNVMNENRCNPLLAFLIITENGVSHVQEDKSKPNQQSGRGLCNKSNFNINR